MINLLSYAAGVAFADILVMTIAFGWYKIQMWKFKKGLKNETVRNYRNKSLYI
jgi:hypothetical protein